MKAIRDCASETGDKDLDMLNHTHTYTHTNLHALENNICFPIRMSILASFLILFLNNI